MFACSILFTDPTSGSLDPPPALVRYGYDTFIAQAVRTNAMTNVATCISTSNTLLTLLLLCYYQDQVRYCRAHQYGERTRQSSMVFVPTTARTTMLRSLLRQSALQPRLCQSAFSAVHRCTGHVPSLGTSAINLVLQPRTRGESEAKCVRPNQFPELSTCSLKFDALGRFSKALTDLTTGRVPNYEATLQQAMIPEAALDTTPAVPRMIQLLCLHTELTHTFASLAPYG